MTWRVNGRWLVVPPVNRGGDPGPMGLVWGTCWAVVDIELVTGVGEMCGGGFSTCSLVVKLELQFI